MIERVFVTLLVAFGALTAVRVIAPFRALLLPALPRRGRGRLRRVLGVHSYLPRWWSAGYFVSTWAFGLAAVFLALRLDLDRMSPWLASAVATVSYLGLSVYIGAAHVYYHDVRGREQLRIQHRRDAWAEQALTDLRHGRESRGHSVWLRSFQSTGRVRVIAKSKYVKLKGEDVEKGGLHIYLGDFETMLAEAVEHVAPLIALGESGEQIGAGRVRTREEDWREVFTLLTASAHTIYLMPSLRPGTQWELDQVLTTPDLLRRCVFVLPPEYEPRLRVRARFEEPGAARTRNTDVTAARVDAIEAFA
ncbi:MAG: hypothetical protein QOF58_7436, partial [Pseudonocardiales bacterium]|nr:hypothetical protein [Pseudonocardiales bacterium]